MKPTKIRNRKIYRAMNQTVSKQICAALSKDLRKKYPRRSARIMIDDTVKVIRGEYKGLTGKVAKISTESNSIAIEGNKKEKLKGEKVDVYIHSTNTIITSLNTDDKWRLKILEKKSKSKIKAMKEEAKKKSEVKSADKSEVKSADKSEVKSADKKKSEVKSADKKKSEVKSADKSEVKSADKKKSEVKSADKKKSEVKSADKKKGLKDGIKDRVKK
jgi:large subunit ribosomal protein L24